MGLEKQCRTETLPAAFAARVALALALALFSAIGLAAASPAAARDAGPERLDGLASQLLPVRGGADRAIASARKVDLTISRAGRVLVQVYVSGSADAAVAPLRSAGMSVRATAEEPLPVVEGWVPAAKLAAVAALGTSNGVMPVLAGGSDAGSVLSGGIAAHRIPQALAAGAGNGSGVDVGVVSTSIDQVGGGIAGSKATGDLPQVVTVLKDDPGAADDEGRAMAEIIFDGAPGIDSILFASGTADGPVGKADSIDRLVAAGAEVIADDIFWLNEPFFQDGVVAQAVDRARAAGVTYLASAGNRARQSWEGTYNGPASNTPQGFHDFSTGLTPVDATPQVQTLTTVPPVDVDRPEGGLIQLVFQWDEPWGQAANDFDIELVRADGTPLPCAGAQPGQNPSGGTDNNLLPGGLPLEVVTWQNNCNVGPVSVGLKITRFAGTGTPFMKYIARGNFGTFDIVEHPTGSNTINPDAASASGALTVAAVGADDPGLDTPRAYSSRGPATTLFDAAGVRLPAPQVRLKPELAAADGVSTTVPGFESFFGTSAAVPSAAGIAAVLRSSRPGAGAGEIERVLTRPENAIDCTSSSLIPDPDCGAGFLLADSAFQSLDSDGPLVRAQLSPSRPDGRGGWFTRTVQIRWSVTDSSSEVTSGECPPATLSTDGVRTFSCVATSSGGTSSSTVRVKRDTARPSRPRIIGIRPRSYRRSGRLEVPAKNRVRCRSSDRTSGLASCRITGYSRRPGRHTIVARATDRAGLSSVTRLRYRVLRR
jgi:hypothetical protein